MGKKGDKRHEKALRQDRLRREFSMQLMAAGLPPDVAQSVSSRRLRDSYLGNSARKRLFGSKNDAGDKYREAQEKRAAAEQLVRRYPTAREA